MKNLLIVPTRSRPNRMIEFFKYFKENSSVNTKLCIAIDNDDDSGYNQSLFPDVLWEVNDRMFISDILNLISNKYCYEYDYISFMGDDHLIKTYNWDNLLLRDPVEYLVAYGNDLIQGAALPTAVLMDSKIIKEMKQMCPSQVKHVYLDNYWKHLGEHLGTLRYYNDVIIEHMHHSVGKAPNDDTYKYTHNRFQLDGIAWENYKNQYFNVDVSRIKNK